MTTTSVLPAKFIKTVQVFTVVFALSMLWAAMPMQAKAATMTDSQIEAVRSLLSSFGADKLTVAKVEVSLREPQTVRAALTQTQIRAVLSLLQSFGVEPRVASNVERDLRETSSAGETLAVSPASGQKPLAVTFTAQYLKTTGTYLINYGDRAPLAICRQSSSGVDACGDHWSGRHVYASAGAYTAQLLYQASSCQNRNTCDDTKIVGTVAINVSGAATSSAPVITSISPAQGSANTIVTLHGSGLLSAGGSDPAYPAIEWLKNGSVIGGMSRPVITSSSSGTTLQFKISAVWAAHVPVGAYQLRYASNASAHSNAVSFTLSDPAAAVAGTFDADSLTASVPAPTLHGTARNISRVGLAIGNSGGKIYATSTIAVVNGKWSTKIPPLSNGNYAASLYGASSNLLAQGTLKINAPAQAATPTAYTISGVVWVDTNGNAAKDGSEAGMANTAVNLGNSATGAVLRTATTDTAGNYSIANVAAGTYRIAHPIPTGYVRTTDASLVFTLSGNYTRNFGVKPATVSLANSLVGAVVVAPLSAIIQGLGRLFYEAGIY